MTAVAHPPAARTSPWKGLAPYDDSSADAQLFFGRDREVEVAAANLRAARLTVLFGASGVGKSSLLRAGVVRRLREDGAGESAAALVSSWAGDAVAAVAAAAREAVEASLGRPVDDPGGTLAERLRAWCDELGGELYLVLDQLEEYFLYHAGETGPGSFAAEFPPLVTERGLRVHVLLGIREDALGLLDAFRAAVPGVLSNYLRLERLDRDAARAAVLGPIGRWNELEPGDPMAAEPELVEAVLDEVAAGRIEPEAGGLGGVTPSALVERIEAPYLQLVLERLWETERADGSAVLRRETLRRLGGAGRIVEEHLDRSLASLDDEERDGAAAVFAYLVTPSGTKIAHSVGDLGSYARLPPERAAGLVATLEHGRILRPAEGGRVEIFHDVLAAAVGDWRRRHEAARTLERERRRHRRLFAGLVAAVASLVVVAAIAVYAVVQRREAQAQARAAEARALVGEGSAALAADPAKSVRLAVRAARIEPSPTAEELLRTALLYPHVIEPPRRGRPATNLEAEGAGVRVRADGMGVVVTGPNGRTRRLNHGAAVTAVDVDPTGRHVVTAGGLRAAKVWDARSGRLLHVLNEHFAPVQAVALSPDGALVATGSVDSGVRLFDAESGALAATMIRHSNYVVDVDFSDDGATLASASLDRTARLWQVATGRALGVLSGHRAGVVSVEVESIRRVVTVGRDGTVLVFDATFEPQLEPVATLSGPVESISLGGGVGTVVATASGRAWSVALRERSTRDLGTRPAVRPPARIDGAVVRLPSGVVLRGHRRPVTSVTVSPDGRLIATTSRDADARVWDRESGRLLRVLRGHFGPVAAAAFSPDGRWLVTAGPATAGLWRLSSGALVYFMRGHSAPLTAVAFAPGGRIVTGSRDGELRTVRCEICGGVDELVRLAERRLALAGG